MTSPASPLHRVLTWVIWLSFAAMFTMCLLLNLALQHTKKELAEEQSAYAKYRSEVTESALKEETKRRAAETKLQEEANEQAKTLQAQIDGLQRNRSTLAADNQRLHKLAKIYATYGNTADTPTRFAAAGKAADSTAGVLADLLGRIDEVAGIYAAEADEARVRGLGCEAAYDAAREATQAQTQTSAK